VNAPKGEVSRAAGKCGGVDHSRIQPIGRRVSSGWRYKEQSQAREEGVSSHVAERV
jgi:hypothetical protein